MKQKKHIQLIFLGLGLVPFFNHEGWTYDLDLKEAYRLCLSNNVDIQTADQAYKEARAKRDFNASKFMPALSFTGVYRYSKDRFLTAVPLSGEIEPSNFTSLTMRFQQPIYNATIWNNVSAADAEIEFEKHKRDSAETKALSQVAFTYFESILASEKLKVLTHAEDVLREQSRITESRVNAGYENQLRSLQVKSELAQLRARMLSARQYFENSLFELKKLLGLDLAETIILKDPLDFGVFNIPDTEKSLAQAFSNRTDLLILKTQIQQLQDNQKVEMAQFKPTLQALGELGFNTLTSHELFDYNNQRYFAGLQLDIPLFNGFGSNRLDNKQQAALKKMSYQLEDLKRRVVLEVANARARIMTAKANEEAGRFAIEVAEKALKITQDNYKVGKMLYVELMDTYRRELETKTSYLEIKFNLIKEYIGFLQAMGKPLAERL